MLHHIMVHVFSSVWLLNWRLADSSGAWGKWAGGGLLAPGLHTQSAHYWAQQQIEMRAQLLTQKQFIHFHIQLCIYSSAVKSKSCVILLLQICRFLVTSAKHGKYSKKVKCTLQTWGQKYGLYSLLSWRKRILLWQMKASSCLSIQRAAAVLLCSANTCKNIQKYMSGNIVYVTP